MKRLASMVLAGLLAGGCASVQSNSSKSDGVVAQRASQELQNLDPREVIKWVLENEALVEWQLALLAANCNQVATTTRTPAARREALRVKAAYATSSYAVVSGPNPLAQVLDLLALSVLWHNVWIEEGRAKSEFGEDARPVEVAFTEIRDRTREYARKHLSAQELQAVETMVRQWRKAHPGPVVLEFIRFESFADEVARSLGQDHTLGGLFGRIAAQAQNAQLLGERFLMLASRGPRLAQWHAEASAANVLAQPEVAEVMAALKRLDDLQRTLPEQFNTLKALDRHLGALPEELAAAVVRQPELKTTLTHMEQASRHIKALDGSVTELGKSVATLGNQLAQLAATTHPDSLRKLADHSGGVVLAQARSVIVLATGCALVVVVLHALLRRWNRRTSQRE